MLQGRAKSRWALQAGEIGCSGTQTAPPGRNHGRKLRGRPRARWRKWYLRGDCPPAGRAARGRGWAMIRFAPPGSPATKKRLAGAGAARQDVRLHQSSGLWRLGTGRAGSEAAVPRRPLLSYHFFLAPQGLHGFLAPQGLQGLHGFFAAQGLHGFLAPQGLHGFLAAQGLHGFLAPQGLHGFLAPQGLQGLHGFFVLVSPAA
jgi:hypothetical protein